MTFANLLRQTPVTALLLVSFVVLFIIQVATGVDINQPSGESLLVWGANALPYSMGYEPWRLLSSAFLHIGFMHLLFNCFAMYFFGRIVELTFGSVKFLCLFLLSAIGGNLLNNYVTWWQFIYNDGHPNISAGASGGIMGMGMALLMVELLKHSLLNFPHKVKNPQLKSLAIIMGINLLYGFAIPGIDNAGHIGGALTGALLAIGTMLGYRYSNKLAASANQLSKFNILPWLIYILLSLVFLQLWLNLHYKLLL